METRVKVRIQQIEKIIAKFTFKSIAVQNFRTTYKLPDLINVEVWSIKFIGNCAHKYPYIDMNKNRIVYWNNINYVVRIRGFSHVVRFRRSIHKLHSNIPTKCIHACHAQLSYDTFMKYPIGLRCHVINASVFCY